MEPMKQADDLSYSVFAGLLKTKFRIPLGNGTSIELELVEVQQHLHSLPEKPGAMATESFSLFLTGPLKPLLPQRIYPFEHETLGQLSLFIVPIGQEPQGIKYEAVFNRVKR